MTRRQLCQRLWLDSFDDKPILVADGTDKSLDFTVLADNASKAKSLYLLAGSGTDILIPMLEARGVPYQGPFSSLKDTLVKLKDNLRNQDSKVKQGENHLKPTYILLSPGATSFGMFANEFDRGNTFKLLVKDLF